MSERFILVRAESESQYILGSNRSSPSPELFVWTTSLTLQSSTKSEYRSYDRSRRTRHFIENADDMDFDQEENDRDGPLS